MPPRASRTGSLTVIAGCMFSGKTEELIRLARRAMHARRRVQVFRSALDTRCETEVVRTHDGVQFMATPAATSADVRERLAPDVDVVAIEEVQFFDEGIVALVTALADRGVDVIAAGLDQDFRGEPFGCVPRLMALAESVVKLRAICKRCGGEASRTQRLVDGRPAAWDDPTILVGAEEAYEARCRRCHQVRGVPRARKAQSPGRVPSAAPPQDGPAEGLFAGLADT